MRVLVLVLLVTLVSAHRAKHLGDIKTLTLHRGRMTATQRGSPIRQLECVGGNACGRFEPEVMQCYNQGADDRGEVQWKCQAEMPKAYRLGATTVSCEGFTSPDDDFVLEGSCGVEYTLHTEEHVHPQKHSSGIDTSGVAFFLLFVIILVSFALCCAFPPSSTSTHHYSPPVTRSRNRSRVQETYGSHSPHTVVHETHHHDSGPGFWTGYAVGASTGSSRTTEHHYHSPAPSVSSSTASSHTSTGYGGTKKR